MLSEKFAELQAGLVSGTSMHGRLAHRPARVWRSLRRRASGVGQKTAWGGNKVKSGAKRGAAGRGVCAGVWGAVAGGKVGARCR